MQLSPNFRLSELVASSEAKRRSLANFPAAADVDNLRSLCRGLLEPVRAALGPLRVTSGLRVPALNRAVGGSASSAHVIGWAADVVPVRASLEDVMRFVASSPLAWDQVILEPSWIHFGLRRPITGEQRRQLLVAKGKGFVDWRPAA